MIDFTKYRKYGIILLILYLIVTFLMFTIIWKSILKIPEVTGTFQIILFIILSILLNMLLFVIFMSGLSNKKLNTLISKEREKAKSDVLQQINTDKEQKIEKEDTEQEQDMNTLLQKIIPSGRTIKNLDSYCEKLLSNMAKEMEITQGICYIKQGRKNTYSALSTYAWPADSKPQNFDLGKTLPGEAAKSMDIIAIQDIPDDYVDAKSGLGESKPKNIYFIPIKVKSKALAVIEFGTFKELNKTYTKLLELLSNKIGEKLQNLLTK